MMWKFVYYTRKIGKRKEQEDDGNNLAEEDVLSATDDFCSCEDINDASGKEISKCEHEPDWQDDSEGNCTYFEDKRHEESLAQNNGQCEEELRPETSGYISSRCHSETNNHGEISKGIQPNSSLPCFSLRATHGECNREHIGKRLTVSPVPHGPHEYRNTPGTQICIMPGYILDHNDHHAMFLKDGFSKTNCVYDDHITSPFLNNDHNPRSGNKDTNSRSNQPEDASPARQQTQVSKSWSHRSPNSVREYDQEMILRHSSFEPHHRTDGSQRRNYSHHPNYEVTSSEESKWKSNEGSSSSEYAKSIGEAITVSTTENNDLTFPQLTPSCGVEGNTVKGQNKPSDANSRHELPFDRSNAEGEMRVHNTMWNRPYNPSCEYSQECELSKAHRSIYQRQSKRNPRGLPMHNAKESYPLINDSGSTRKWVLMSNEATSFFLKQQLIYDMWKENQFCDVTVMVDGRYFYAHKVILAASSEYFEWLFLNSTSATHTDQLTVVIDQIPGDVFEAVLSYIYTSYIEVETGQIYQLLKASLFLTIKLLTDVIQNLMLKCWRKECINAFCVARVTCLDKLCQMVTQHIRTNFLEVSKSEEFATCPAEHVIAILADGNLLVNEEMDILHSIMMWLRKHPHDTASHMMLLRSVRFQSIPRTTLGSLVKNDSDIMATGCVKQYLDDAWNRASSLGASKLTFHPPVARQHIQDVAECKIPDSKDVQTHEPSNKLKGRYMSGEKSTYGEQCKPNADSPATRSSLTSPSTRLIDCSLGVQCRLSSISLKESSMATKGTQFPSNEDHYVIPSQSSDDSPLTSPITRSTITATSQFPSNDRIGTKSFPFPVIPSNMSMESAIRSYSEGTLNSSEYSDPDAPPTGEIYSRVCLVRLGGLSRTQYGHDGRNVDVLEIGKANKWKTIGKLPLSISHHAACFIHDSVYVTGGRVSSREDLTLKETTPCRYLYKFDITEGKWHRLADMEYNRAFHSSVALFGQLYVVGGLGEDGRALQSVERYSPYTDSWRCVAPLSFPRYATAAAVYHFQLWTAGGATGHNARHTVVNQINLESSAAAEHVMTAVVEFYSPHDNSWTQTCDLLSPRCNSSLVRVNNRLYIVGGYGSNGRGSSRGSGTCFVDEYDDAVDTWGSVAETTEGDYSNNTVSVGSKIIIVGHMTHPTSGKSKTAIAIFDTSTSVWDAQCNFIPGGRTGHASCPVPSSQLEGWLRR